MPLKINGTTYLTANEVVASIDVTRQTFHRWRKEGKAPSGHKYRNQVVFTKEEFEQIEEYANRVEPVNLNTSTQIPLFRSNANSQREN